MPTTMMMLPRSSATLILGHEAQSFIPSAAQQCFIYQSIMAGGFPHKIDATQRRRVASACAIIFAAAGILNTSGIFRDSHVHKSDIDIRWGEETYYNGDLLLGMTSGSSTLWWHASARGSPLNYFEASAHFM